MYLVVYFYCTYTMICLRESAELFATSSRNDVRVWHASTGKELLRIAVPNLLCNALEITPDGNAIITGKLLPTMIVKRPTHSY